jgi:hypothetical protein
MAQRGGERQWWRTRTKCVVRAVYAAGTPCVYESTSSEFLCTPPTPDEHLKCNAFFLLFSSKVFIHCSVICCICVRESRAKIACKIAAVTINGEGWKAKPSGLGGADTASRHPLSTTISSLLWQPSLTLLSLSLVFLHSISFPLLCIFCFLHS